MLHIFISAADDDIRPGATGTAGARLRRRRCSTTTATRSPDGEPGRLAVQGPTGCRYLADPRQPAYVQNGWNITGDTFIRDADGYFWYQARSDDMIVSSGYNIAGARGRGGAAGAPRRRWSARWSASPDEARGHVVKAFVVLAGGWPPCPTRRREPPGQELQDFVKATIAPYKYPRVIEFVDALPRTSTGKLQRFKLRQLERQNTGEPAR